MPDSAPGPSTVAGLAGGEGMEKLTPDVFRSLSDVLFTFGPAALLVFMVAFVHRKARGDLDRAYEPPPERSRVVAALAIYCIFWLVTLGAAVLTVVVFWRLTIRPVYVIQGTLEGLTPDAVVSMSTQDGYTDAWAQWFRRWIVLSRDPLDSHVISFIVTEPDQSRVTVDLPIERSFYDRVLKIRYDRTAREAELTEPPPARKLTVRPR